MSLLSDIFTGGAGDAIGSVINKVLDFIPDPVEKAKAAAEAEKEAMAQALALAQQQTDINKVEAANSSIFVAGWRPAIGWICGIILLYVYVVGPLLGWLFAVVAFFFGTTIPAPPKMDLSDMMPVLLGMLGLGGMRTIEKVNNVKKTGH